MAKTEIDACVYSKRFRMRLKIRFMKGVSDNKKWKEFSKIPRRDNLPELSKKNLIYVLLKDN